MVKNSLYSAAALILLSVYSVHGFEPLDIQSTGVTSANITAAQFKKADDYCLVFEDHFDTFNLKNWQVRVFILFIYVSCN